MSLTQDQIKKSYIPRATLFTRTRCFCDYCKHGGHKKAYRSYWGLLMHMARDHKDEKYRETIISLLHTHGGFTHAPADSATDKEFV